jgi:hypothetical protein
MMQIHMLIDMQKRWTKNQQGHHQLELKKDKERKYIGYLEKRYGKKRAQSFAHSGS